MIPSQAEFNDLVFGFMTIGVAVLGLGLAMRAVSPGVGMRVARIGGSILFVTVFGAFLTPLAVSTLGETGGTAVLAGLAIVMGLVILQNVLNLIFGSNVGSRVTAELVTGTLRLFWSLLAVPISQLGRFLGR